LSTRLNLDKVSLGELTRGGGGGRNGPELPFWDMNGPSFR